MATFYSLPRLYVLMACDRCERMGHARITGISIPAPSAPDDSMGGMDDPTLDVDEPQGWMLVREDHFSRSRAYCDNCKDER